ncbi:MAG TPA: hypothetical protein VFQ61_00745, partial [Polyangiaceae bacterium]|nr:hypothetical protein [Polyangiaceae bacterium]
GSLGHIPLSRIRGYRLARVNLESGELERDARGFAIECKPGELGELLLRLRVRPDSSTGDYTGYLGESERPDRIARDVFRPGDLYCRSGDLMRRDRLGYYYFVDRLGDTFRCKGHNVSTREVEDALSRTPGVRMLSCTGLRLPSHDGKFGLLTLAVANDFRMADLERQLPRLPPYAQPGFLRFVPEVALTSSLKAKRVPVLIEDLSPGSGAQAFWRQGDHFVPLTRADYERIAAGQQRF